MRRFATALAVMAGWRRFAAAAGAGAVSAAAMPPIDLWPVLFATIPVLVWLLDGAAARARLKERMTRAALDGWAFGFGYFLLGLYWIGAAFLVEAEVFAWLMPFAVAGMPAGLALFTALGTATAAALWRPGLARLFALAFALAAAEWLRGHALTGFPWNAFGYALASGETMMQWASLFGIYGLTLLAVLVFSAPAAIWSPEGRAQTAPALRALHVALAAAVLCAGAGWGKLRLDSASDGWVEGVRLRIVQPNIPQKEKWKPENAAPIYDRYLGLSRGGAGNSLLNSGITHLIWPESAVPFLLEETPEALDALAGILPEGTVFITGALRAGAVQKVPGGTRRPIYNSLFVMDAQARMLEVYDKVWLVPFGEFLPLQHVLEALGMEQLTRIQGGFAAGGGARLIEAPGAPPFAPLICYEIIFPGAATRTGARPQWMLNVTNDAWFGHSSGPFQHFRQARVRAVEQGLPVVRAANTGISAVIDAYGRITARVPFGATGIADAELPAAIAPTPASRWGGRILAAMLALTLIGWLALRNRGTGHG